MQTATHCSTETREGATGAAYVSLAAENRTAVETACAAYHLSRKPQTLRGWAMRDGTGPIRCFRINGRLAWPVADLKRVLGVA